MKVLDIVETPAKSGDQTEQTGTGGFITNDPYSVNYDASGGYSQEAGKSKELEVYWVLTNCLAAGGYGAMGGADMAAYQQPHDPYAIKSDPEHGKLLKKVFISQN